MLEAFTPEGLNVILYAAVCKNFEAVNYLCMHGYNLNVEDSEGKTLLLHLLL
jgi:ankyrin repeat protein